MFFPKCSTFNRRINNILCGELEARRDDRLARFNRRELVAGGLELRRARRFKYRYAHAAAHREVGVDDRVSFERRNIGALFIGGLFYRNPRFLRNWE